MNVPVGRTPSEPTPIPVRVHRLSESDRCDRCPARAYVRVELGGTELLWCAHHYAGARVRLEELGAKVTGDDRALLDPP